MYESPKKLSDNEALNEIVDNVKSINKKISLFYYLAILSILLYVLTLIIPHISMGTI